jgi:serine/threonine protein kinase
MMLGRKEVWEQCRSFGMISDQAVRYTFYQICKSVKQLHELKIIHRDLKVSLSQTMVVALLLVGGHFGLYGLSFT